MANRQIPCTRRCTWDLTYSIDSTDMLDIIISTVSISNIAISTATTEAQSVRSKTASKESFRY